MYCGETEKGKRQRKKQIHKNEEWKRGRDANNIYNFILVIAIV